MSRALKTALKNELRRQTESDPPGTTNFSSAPVNSQFVTPLKMSGSQPGYMRGRWRKIARKNWVSPKGMSLTVNAERVSGGFPEYQFVYFNSHDTVQVVG